MDIELEANERIDDLEFKNLKIIQNKDGFCFGIDSVLLSDFAKASETFLASQTYNAEKVALPNHETVPYWQGSGVGYSFDDVSTINVKTASKKDVNVSGILGVIFDRDALGVSNLDRRVTTNYNPRAEFYTNFYKFDAGYYNDLSENFVLFFIG